MRAVQKCVCPSCGYIFRYSDEIGQMIFDTVCEVLQVSVTDAKQFRGTWGGNIVQARRLAMFFIMRLTGATYAEASSICGFKYVMSRRYIFDIGARFEKGKQVEYYDAIMDKILEKFVALKLKVA